jgi:hypothetical protein
MRSLLWTIRVNTYWTATKLATFTPVLPVCPQCGQHTVTMRHTLIDCHSIESFWINAMLQLSAILEIYSFD